MRVTSFTASREHLIRADLVGPFATFGWPLMPMVLVAEQVPSINPSKPSGGGRDNNPPKK